MPESYVTHELYHAEHLDEFDREQYDDHLQQALADPEYDFFNNVYHPLPKRDIGQYVASFGIPVPNITSQQQWEAAFDVGHGMLRSEMPQDYAGYSGILESKRLTEPDFENYDYHLAKAPVEIPQLSVPKLGTRALEATLKLELTSAMRAGQLHPGQYMKHLGSDYGLGFGFSRAIDKGIPISHLSNSFECGVSASFWRYVPGQNITVFRDPVKPGHYYMRGNSSNHAFEVSPEDIDEPRIFRRDGHYSEPRTTEAGYTFPTQRVIELYERVRSLPLFDSRQLPVMEMQYGDDGVLYFLQYLKTGNTLSEGKKFEIPKGQNIVPLTEQVRGETAAEGSRHRLYIAPHHWAKRLVGQAVFLDVWNSSADDLFTQHLCMKAAVMMTNGYLSFKNNHFDDALLHRPGVSIAFWRDKDLINNRIKAVSQEFRTDWDPPYQDLKYIEATIWANGFEAGIESDWLQRSEQLS